MYDIITVLLIDARFWDFWCIFCCFLLFWLLLSLCAGTALLAEQSSALAHIAQNIRILVYFVSGCWPADTVVILPCLSVSFCFLLAACFALNCKFFCCFSARPTHTHTLHGKFRSFYTPSGIRFFWGQGRGSGSLRSVIFFLICLLLCLCCFFVPARWFLSRCVRRIVSCVEGIGLRVCVCFVFSVFVKTLSRQSERRGSGAKWAKLLVDAIISIKISLSVIIICSKVPVWYSVEAVVVSKPTVDHAFFPVHLFPVVISPHNITWFSLCYRSVCSSDPGSRNGRPSSHPFRCTSCIL